LGREKVDSAIQGDGSALDERERAVMGLVAAGGVCGDRSRTDAAPEIQAAIDDCKRAGWSERAIYHAITVIALFNFYNAWVDCSGVEALTAGGYEQSGKRLKARGYMLHKEIAAADKR
jgi:hypothetical protein